MWLLFAVGAAVSYGIRGILYQWTARQPINRNFMLFGVYATGMVLFFVIMLISGIGWTKPSLAGIAMGVFSFIANGSMYKAYASSKASLVAVLTAFPPIIVTALAFILWGTTLTPLQLSALFFMLVGLLMIRFSASLSLSDLKGIHWGLITVLFFGLNDTTSKQAMRWQAGVLPTGFNMFATGALLFAFVWLIQKTKTSEKDPEPNPSSKPWSLGATFLWGMTVGLTNFCGIYLGIHAMVNGIAGLVSAVLTLNVIIILIYARIRLKEYWSRKDWIGMALSICGVLMLRLFE